MHVNSINGRELERRMIESLPLRVIIAPLLHAHLSWPPEMWDTPEQATHATSPVLKFGTSSLTPSALGLLHSEDGFNKDI
jgi:hypothetical protein